MIAAPDNKEVPRRPSVWIDEYAAAMDATSYLLGLGHKTVHHLSIPTWTGKTRRMSGWLAALKQACVPAPKPMHGGWSADWGYEAGQKLAGDAKVTAVLCGNDDIALGVMRAMHEAGRHVPNEVSIVGFDDVPFARFYTPALTTVRQDFKALGKACFATLMSFVDPRHATERLELPEARLVVRESAGPPGGLTATANAQNVPPRLANRTKPGHGGPRPKNLQAHDYKPKRGSCPTNGKEQEKYEK